LILEQFRNIKTQSRLYSRNCFTISVECLWLKLGREETNNKNAGHFKRRGYYEKKFVFYVVIIDYFYF